MNENKNYYQKNEQNEQNEQNERDMKTFDCGERTFCEARTQIA